MEILTNQTIYQCSYCNKRLLSKNGAKIHEEQYCKDKNSPHKKNIADKQSKCTHENVETMYRTIPGESHLKEPYYDLCVDCGWQG